MPTDYVKYMECYDLTLMDSCCTSLFLMQNLQPLALLKKRYLNCYWISTEVVMVGNPGEFYAVESINSIDVSVFVDVINISMLLITKNIAVC